MSNGDFSEGIRILNTKGALIIPGIRLTKKRARILIDFVGEFKFRWNTRHEEGHHAENDMQAAMAWVTNEIWKRWSQNELYTESKQKEGGEDE